MTTNESLLDEMERYLVDPAARHDPYPLFKRLHEEAPVLRSRSGTVIVSRYQDVRSVLTTDAFGVDPLSGGLGAPFIASPDDHRYFMMSFQDPPEHTRLRRLVARHFTPAAMEQHRSLVIATVRSMLPSADAPDFELIGGLAHQLPINVTCAMLSIPETELNRVRHWTESVSRQLEIMGRRDDPLAMAEQHAFAIYAVGLVAGTEDSHGPLHTLREAFTSGQLDPAQLIAYVMLLLIAGRETVTNMVGTAVLTLLRHPDQTELLRDHPERIPKALDECLRYESPVSLVARIVQRPTTVGGIELGRGELVLALIGAGNRDEAVFPDASRFDTARDARAHLGFGAGVHHCLGMSLARIEGEVVLAELFDGMRRTTSRCDLQTPVWRDSLPFRGPAELHIGFSPRG